MVEDAAAQLLGRWVTDVSDTTSIEDYGQSSLVFLDNSSLRYIIHAEGKDEIIILTYRVEDGFLITNQPSEPREERTSFTLTSDGKLVLDYGGSKSLYVRETQAKGSST